MKSGSRDVKRLSHSLTGRVLMLPLLVAIPILTPVDFGSTMAGESNASVQHPSAACDSLSDVHAPAVKITAARAEPAGSFSQHGTPGSPSVAIELPAHCVVAGVIERRVGVRGKPYGIQFELRMPQDWNGRFLFQGGSGINGFVAPAIGLVKGPPALTKGFAVVTQDAGHEGTDASFGEDQQARIDMIYRSYDRVTTVAKMLVGVYYGKPADHSYFMGCSEGGRQALLVSQRQPLDFDGVVAGDPGFLLGSSFSGTAIRMIVANISPKDKSGIPDLSKAFSPADLKLLADTVIAECDAKDGLRDGLNDNPTACRPNLERLICKDGKKTEACLTKLQVQALRTIFDGGRPSGDRGQLTRGYFYDTGVGLPAWKGKLAGPGDLQVNGVNSTAGLFSTPYDPGYDASAMDFARAGPRFQEVGDLNRTDGVMLSSFNLHGGKLLIYTGLSDQAFSAKDLIAYYQRLGLVNGGAAQTRDFARLFLVPGMTHCRGGASLDEFDPLQAVVDWVENKLPPEQMIATGREFPGRSRPICAFPAETRYNGTGSTEDAANFSCRLPAETSMRVE
jgi:feruloyl esterase